MKANKAPLQRHRPKATNQAGPLVPVDVEPLRSEALDEFQSLYRRYAKHAGELKVFQEKTRPAYDRWFFSLFGDRIRRMQSLHSEFLEKAARLTQLRDKWLFGDDVDFFATDDELDEIDDDVQSEWEWSAEEGFANESDDGSGQESEFSRSHFSEEREDGPRSRRRGSPFDEDGDDFGRTGFGFGSSNEDQETKVKALYRKLARLLHPDLAGGRTELSQEFWQETQRAYEERDLEKLELLWTIVSLRAGAEANELSLFDLRTAVMHMAAELTRVKREKRRLAQDDPAWGFDRKSKVELRTKIETDLIREERALQEALSLIDDDILGYERPARSPKGKTSERRRTGSRSRSSASKIRE